MRWRPPGSCCTSTSTLYDTRDGLWNPGHGEVEIPEDWDLLPAGDAFLTRTVKGAGDYWLAWKLRTRSSPHRRLIGVWAPRSTIETARAAAEATAAKRARQRQQGDAHRQRREVAYQAELRDAIVTFLDLGTAHAALAEQIADEASARAAVVGSGRVGRTRTIGLEDRAALAARACIRHRFTSYEDDLVDQLVWDDDFLYRDVRHAAQRAATTSWRSTAWSRDSQATGRSRRSSGRQDHVPNRPPGERQSTRSERQTEIRTSGGRCSTLLHHICTT